MNECEMCTHPGSCCVIFSLTGGNFKTGLFDEGTDFDKMLVDEKLPFIVRRVVQEGDQVRAFFGCNHLTKGGFCSIYDSRPDVCKNFEPFKETSCIMSPSFNKANNNTLDWYYWFVNK